MASPVKEVSSSSHEPQDEAAATLSELRDSVTAIAKEVAAIAERRARVAGETAKDAAEAGVAELRHSIQRQPVLAVAVAAAAGALLALAVVPRASRRPASRWDRWTPNVTRADLYDLADNIQRSVSRAAGAAAAPVTPAFERMVEALSRADTSSMNSLVEKMSGWFQKAQEKAKQKLG